jgi:hypothetical protein
MESREKLSKITTWFFSTSLPTNVEPMNPAPPVMKMVFPSIMEDSPS